MELNNIEAEQAVLGAVLLQNDTLAQIPQLEAKHFFDPVHGRLFQMMFDMVQGGDLVSPVTMKFRVGDMLADLGGVAYLARLSGAATLSGTKDLAKAIMELWARRDLQDALGEAQERAQTFEGGAVLDIASELERRVAVNLASGGGKPVSSSLRMAMLKAIENTASAYKGEDVGVSSGLDALDNLIGPLKPGRVYIAAGRPSMGKTAVAWNIANRVAARGQGVLFHSGEMPEEDMANRGLSQMLREAGRKVPYFAIERGTLAEDDFRAVIEMAKANENRPIRFIGSEYREAHKLAMALRSTARSMGNVGLIVIDYLQLLQLEGAKSQFDRVGGASKVVKQLAMDLRVPVLLLSQLSRAVEQRDDKRPNLSDLRQSGEIEEDADTVIFTYRPEYYFDREKEPKTPSLAADWHTEKAAAKQVLELIVGKNRAGAIGTAKVRCEIQYNFIEDFPQQELLQGELM